MPIRRATVADVAARLEQAGCIAAEEEASELVHAAPDAPTLEAWIRRREQGEPLAWITGTTTFCGHVLRVEPQVYVPRWQSEGLARRAASLVPRRSGRALDLCTGTGAIATHLAAVVPGAAVVATDLDARAVRCARRNGVVAVLADLGEPFRAEAFDVVTVVPPYVPSGDIRLLPADVQRYEPGLALDGGHDGLVVARRAAEAAARVLTPAGWFLTEVGADQAAALAPTLASLGFAAIEPWFDGDGDLRGVAAQLVRRRPRTGAVRHP